MKLTPETLRELLPDDELDRLMESAGIPGAAELAALPNHPAAQVARDLWDATRELIRTLLVMQATDTPLPPETRALINEANRLVKERVSKLGK